VYVSLIVALLVALMASDKITAATPKTNELPITSNDTTRQISDIITRCIFVLSGFIAQLYLLYILHPSLAWLLLCSPPFFLLPEISQSSYKKVIEWLARISIRLFNIFRPQAYEDTPAPTAVM
jgi:hypothetical protein